MLPCKKELHRRLLPPYLSLHSCSLQRYSFTDQPKPFTLVWHSGKVWTRQCIIQYNYEEPIILIIILYIIYWRRLFHLRFLKFDLISPSVKFILKIRGGPQDVVHEPGLRRSPWTWSAGLVHAPGVNVLYTSIMQRKVHRDFLYIFSEDTSHGPRVYPEQRLPCLKRLGFNVVVQILFCL